MSRTVEVYTGAYASGKSEISVNRALMLNKQGKDITLVDLDTVEPAYTLRPIKNQLEELGLRVITQESYFGLGETGNVITNQQLNCLSSQGDVVIDVGYGVGGLDILEIINNIEAEENLNIYIVVNSSKPETSTVDNIVNYIKWSKGSDEQKWKKFSGIVSNSHFGDETKIEDVLRGFEITKKAAEILNIPIFAITISENLYPQIDTSDFTNIPVWSLKRYMPKAFW